MKRICICIYIVSGFWVCILIKCVNAKCESLCQWIAKSNIEFLFGLTHILSANVHKLVILNLHCMNKWWISIFIRYLHTTISQSFPSNHQLITWVSSFVLTSFDCFGVYSMQLWKRDTTFLFTNPFKPNIQHSRFWMWCWWYSNFDSMLLSLYI